MADTQNVQSVERTFMIIELLSGQKEMSIKALTEGTGLHKATVFRLLSTLISLGYVSQNPRSGQYRLTGGFLRLSSRFLEHLDVRTHVRPILETLSDASGETVHLVQRNDSEVVYIDKLETSKSSIRMVSRIGLSLPMPCTAVGKAILAECTEEEIRAVWDRCDMQKRTENTITDFDCFMEEIEKTRKRGYAVDNEENEPGVFCIATTLPHFGGRPEYAISISAPTQRIDDAVLKRNVSLLLEAKEKMNAVL